jgi:hypothetical protein
MTSVYVIGWDFCDQDIQYPAFVDFIRPFTRVFFEAPSTPVSSSFVNYLLRYVRANGTVELLNHGVPLECEHGVTNCDPWPAPRMTSITLFDLDLSRPFRETGVSHVCCLGGGTYLGKPVLTAYVRTLGVLRENAPTWKVLDVAGGCAFPLSDLHRCGVYDGYVTMCKSTLGAVSKERQTVALWQTLATAYTNLPFRKAYSSYWKALRLMSSMIEDELLRSAFQSEQGQCWKERYQGP